MSEMADFGETAALRECSQRVKHHVFLEGDMWERGIGDPMEVFEYSQSVQAKKWARKGSGTVKRRRE